MPIMSMGMHPTPRKLVVYLSCDPGYRYVVGVFNLLREDFLGVLENRPQEEEDLIWALLCTYS
jgi:hypothetical protein